MMTWCNACVCGVNRVTGTFFWELDCCASITPLGVASHVCVACSDASKAVNFRNHFTALELESCKMQLQELLIFTMNFEFTKLVDIKWNLGVILKSENFAFLTYFTYVKIVFDLSKQGSTQPSVARLVSKDQCNLTPNQILSFWTNRLSI